MKTFLVDGIEKQSVFCSNDQTLQEVFDFARRNFVPESSIISAIRVDGHDLDEAQLSRMSEKRLIEIDSFELETAHPREIAENTIQNLVEFCSHIKNLSEDSAEDYRRISDLVDAVSIFTESLLVAKQILKTGSLQAVNLLEFELISILKDMKESFEKGEKEYLFQLLQNHLPANIEQWHDFGLPLLLKSRDS